jgi:hypothetical protein
VNQGAGCSGTAANEGEHWQHRAAPVWVRLDLGARRPLAICQVSRTAAPSRIPGCVFLIESIPAARGLRENP